MHTKKYILLILMSVLIGSFVFAIPSHADSNSQGQNDNSEGSTMMHENTMGQGMMPDVVGTVSAISGSTLTVIVKQETGDTTTATTFMVTTTSATTVTKDGTASSLSSIAVGDKVEIWGTVTNTTIAATKIQDGKSNQGEMMDSEKMSPS